MRLAFISLLSLTFGFFLCWSATQTAKQLAKATVPRIEITEGEIR